MFIGSDSFLFVVSANNNDCGDVFTLVGPLHSEMLKFQDDQNSKFKFLLTEMSGLLPRIGSYLYDQKGLLYEWDRKTIRISIRYKWCEDQDKVDSIPYGNWREAKSERVVNDIINDLFSDWSDSLADFIQLRVENIDTKDLSVSNFAFSGSGDSREAIFTLVNFSSSEVMKKF